MAQIRPEEDKLLKIATSIAQWKTDAWIHPANAASFNFESEKPLFETIQSFYKDVSIASFSFVPDSVVATLAQQADDLLKWLMQVQAFNFRDGDPNQNHRSLIVQLRNRWGEAYNYTSPHLALAKVSSAVITQEVSTLKSTVESIVNASRKASEEYINKSKAAEDEWKKRIAETEKVVAAARDVASKAAVSKQAQEFEDEARKCLAASRWWFGGTITTVVLSLVVVYLMFLKDIHSPIQAATQPTQTTTTNQSPAVLQPAQTDPKGRSPAITAEGLQQTVARILIVTLLYGVVVWCARNYFASRHNYTVNRHRRNAMQTFRAFVEGTKDLATQDFILRQAAACAFAPQQSGYLKDESLPIPAPASQIVDVVKPGGN
jgi:hypothetical protein